MIPESCGSMSQMETPVFPGDRFKVQQKRGWFVATIKERRPLKKVLKSLKGRKVDSLGPLDYEYYVHYDFFDSRCDEWVDLDHIDTRIAYPPNDSPEEYSQEFEDGKKKRKRKSLDALRVDEKKLDVVSSVPNRRVGVAAKSSRKGAGGLRQGNSLGGGASSSSSSSSSSSLSLSSEVDGRSKGKKGGNGSENVEPGKNKKKDNSIRTITHCIIGNHRMPAWYCSNYPEDMFEGSGALFLCEYCLDYKQTHNTLFVKHKCAKKSPPGELVYRDMERGVGVWEIDGKVHKAYCQKLCSLAKLFLNDKSVCNNTDSFFFYVLCEVDERGAHIVGYFSKEKASPMHYNVACILVLPPFLKKGYGKLLVSLSYEFSKIDGNFRATPERPLSDLGEKGYMTYWCQTLASYFHSEEGVRLKRGGTLKEISRETGMAAEDVVAALNYMGSKTVGLHEDAKALKPSDKMPAKYVNHFLRLFAKKYQEKVGQGGYAKLDCMGYVAKPIAAGTD